MLQIPVSEDDVVAALNARIGQLGLISPELSNFTVSRCQCIALHVLARPLFWNSCHVNKEMEIINNLDGDISRETSRSTSCSLLVEMSSSTN